MNKKLIAMAIAGVVVAVPMMAQAEVKLTGKVQVELNDEDADGRTGTIGIDDDTGYSRWGIWASEDIGGGMTAIAKLEFDLDPADNGNEGNRDQYVGLKGGWGTLAAGRMASPYKTTAGTGYDPLNETHLQSRRMGGASGNSDGYGHNGFVSNSIMYSSPSWSGFSFDVMVAPDETAQGTDGDMDLSLGVKYGNDMFEVAVAHNQLNVPNASDEEMTKIGGQVKLGGMHTIAARYEWISSSAGSATGNIQDLPAYSKIDAGEDGNIWFLSYQLKMGSNRLVAQLGNTETDTSGGSESDYWAVGMFHDFSKTASVFGGFAESDANNVADRNVWTLGMRKTF